MRFRWTTRACEDPGLSALLNNLEAHEWEIFSVSATPDSERQGVWRCLVVARRPDDDLDVFEVAHDG